ncbi:MAG: UDP-glucose/GDP-mannose dehydrogenase family protein [Myxococcota bacterium]|jgi:UDPglucose 6-dehydrogenase|nr:UDP-glucose/GDP-mannose dehydrogenase family protein [Myxococcota bacterium]
MNVCVVGCGYVGLVTGACFSEFGLNVTCTDRDRGRIEDLQAGRIPIYEPGLSDLVDRSCKAGRLSFTDAPDEAIRAGLVVFIAVGTPSADDGSTDLSFVEAVAREIGRNLDGYKVIVTKSTVPVGTSQKVRGWIEEELEAGGKKVDFSVVSNPEFLREGAAIGDFLRPDRVVVGTESGDHQAEAIMKDLYRPLFLNETPFVFTDVASSEISKYAANAFLATKISFINELSILCDDVGGDVQGVARAMGLDRRIGSKFLHAGPGYGGSCFPKDTRAAAHFVKERGRRFEIVEAAMAVNGRQLDYAVEKLALACDGDLAGKTVAILGLSFKPETDDIREGPALEIIRQLLEAGAHIRAFDPHAMESAASELPEVTMCKDAYNAAEGAEVLAIVTEWNEFRALEFPRLREVLAAPKLVDFRNIYDPESVRTKGFEYWGIGRS